MGTQHSTFWKSNGYTSWTKTNRMRFKHKLYSIITMLTCLEIQERKKEEMHALTC